MDHKQVDAPSQWSFKNFSRTQTFAAAVTLLFFVAGSSMINSSEQSLTGQGWSYLRDQGSRIVQSTGVLSSLVGGNELAATRLAKGSLEKKRQNAESEGGSGRNVQRKMGGAQKPIGNENSQTSKVLIARPGSERPADASMASKATTVVLSREVTKEKGTSESAASSANSDVGEDEDRTEEGLSEEGTNANVGSENKGDQASFVGVSEARAESILDPEGRGQQADMGVVSAVLKNLNGDHSLTLELQEGRIKSVNVVKRDGAASRDEVGAVAPRETDSPEEETFPLKSTARCLRDADGSDICYFGGPVCFDKTQEKMVLIDSERKGQEFASTIIFQEGRWTNGRYPPDSKWPLPVNNKIQGVWKGPEALANATLLDGALWIVRPETDTTDHIWHTGMSFTGLLQAQMRNGSGELPPQDYVLVLNETEYHEFNLGILNITTQSQTKAIFKKDLAQGGSTLLCGQRGGITSYKPFFSVGPLDASELRARAYEHQKVPVVNRANWTRVTVLNRPEKFPRHIENVEDIMSVIEKLGLAGNLIQEVSGQPHMTFRQQVVTMSETGILIASHGAALSNMVWLPENAAVIELFPDRFLETEFRNMAAARNLIYFGVESVNYTHPQKLVDYSLEDIARCQSLHSIDHAHDGTCNPMSKNYPFRVPVEELERAIRSAVEHFFTLEVAMPLQKR